MLNCNQQLGWKREKLEWMEEREIGMDGRERNWSGWKREVLDLIGQWSECREGYLYFIDTGTSGGGVVKRARDVGSMGKELALNVYKHHISQTTSGGLRYII